jgi:hypothetical protein
VNASKEKAPGTGSSGSRAPSDLASLSTVHGLRYLIWASLLLIFTLAFAAAGVALAASPTAEPKSVSYASLEVTIASMFVLGALCAAVMLAMGIARMIRGRGEFGPTHRRNASVGAVLLGAGMLAFLAGESPAAQTSAVGGALALAGTLLLALGLASMHWSIARPGAKTLIVLTAAAVSLAPVPLVALPAGPGSTVAADIIGICAMVTLVFALRDVYGRILVGETRPSVGIGAEEEKDDASGATS